MYGVIFDLENLQKQLLKLKALSEEENFWSDNNKAKKVMVEISELDQNIKLISDFEKKITEVKDFFNIANDENDQLMISECNNTLKELLSDLEKSEFQMQFNGDTDSNSCYLEIHAGAGGTESQDWAEMLSRMYQRFAEKNDYKSIDKFIKYFQERN